MMFVIFLLVQLEFRFLFEMKPSVFEVLQTLQLIIQLIIHT
jgi:hypothetical protein